MVNRSIKGLIPRSGDCLLVDLFGYSTKGLPGFEIVGLSKHAKALKEKIVYLTRKEGIAVAPKRYVICIDTLEELSRVDQVKWLELPALILYWSLVEALQIKHLEGCVASGMVSIQGEVSSVKFLNRWQSGLEGKTIIGKGEGPSFQRALSLEEIFKERREVYFKAQAC